MSTKMFLETWCHFLCCFMSVHIFSHLARPDVMLFFLALTFWTRKCHAWFRQQQHFVIRVFYGLVRPETQGLCSNWLAKLAKEVRFGSKALCPLSIQPANLIKALHFRPEAQGPLSNWLVTLTKGIALWVESTKPFIDLASQFDKGPCVFGQKRMALYQIGWPNWQRALCFGSTAQGPSSIWPASLIKGLAFVVESTRPLSNVAYQNDKDDTRPCVLSRNLHRFPQPSPIDMSLNSGNLIGKLGCGSGVFDRFWHVNHDTHGNAYATHDHEQLI